MLDGVSVPAEDSAELYLAKNLKKISLQITLRKNKVGYSSVQDEFKFSFRIFSSTLICLV